MKRYLYKLIVSAIVLCSSPALLLGGYKPSGMETEKTEEETQPDTSQEMDEEKKENFNDVSLEDVEGGDDTDVFAIPLDDSEVEEQEEQKELQQLQERLEKERQERDQKRMQEEEAEQAGQTAEAQ